MAWKEKNQMGAETLSERGSEIKKKSLEKTMEDLIADVSIVIEYKSRLALGKLPPPGFEMFHEKSMEDILDLARPLIQNYSVTKKLSVESVSDIVKMLSQGKITVNEAKELMLILNLKYEVDDQKNRASLNRKILDLLG